MTKGGVTKALDDAVEALDSNQLKKALYLTENNPKLERHHQWIEEAARTCIANKDDKAACQAAIKEARDKIQDTITAPIDDDSLEGLEEYLTPRAAVSESEVKEQGQIQEVQQETNSFLAKAEKTDEELYEECEECHVAVAASRFADICSENPEETGSCELIGRSLENEDTEPTDWIKAMVQTAEESQGKAKEEMVAAVTELTDYLERRSSPFLKALYKEEKNGEERTAIPPRTEEEGASSPPQNEF